MRWSSPKTGLEMNFSSLENQNLENVNFSQEELFELISDIPLLISLFKSKINLEVNLK